MKKETISEQTTNRLPADKPTQESFGYIDKNLNNDDDKLNYIDEYKQRWKGELVIRNHWKQTNINSPQRGLGSTSSTTTGLNGAWNVYLGIINILNNTSSTQLGVLSNDTQRLVLRIATKGKSAIIRTMVYNHYVLTTQIKWRKQRAFRFRNNKNKILNKHLNVCSDERFESRRWQQRWK